MTNSNLFRMDDFLLKGALVVGAPVGLVVSGIISAAMGSDFRVDKGLGFALLAASLAPIAMAAVGWGLRRREKRALALWKLIDREVEIASDDLMRHSDWTAPLLDQAIRDLNNAGVAFVVWDRKSKRVQNGRLRRSTMIVDECAACSGKMSIEVTIGSTASLRCPYCHEPIDVARVAEEKARIIDELEIDRPEAAFRRESNDVGKQSEFSVLIFVLLFSLFWPAGLWYCVKHRTYLTGLIE